MKIEWASSFRSDGTRRRPPPSIMHGWLAKIRGTLLGNEELRSKGMREMKEARAVRKRRAQRGGQSHHPSTGRSIFSFFSFYMGTPTRKKPTRKPAQHSLPPTHGTRQSHRSHRSTQNVRPSPGTSRRQRGPSSRSDTRKYRGRSTR